MKRQILIAVTLSLLTVLVANAQTPQFEAATLKPTALMGGVSGGCRGIDSSPRAAGSIPLGRCVITSARLSHAIGIAFNLGGMNNLRGGPDWVIAGTERYDINAKAENPETATEAQLLTMLQNLLVERFGLKFHKETVESRTYELVMGPRGHKLQTSTEEEVSRTINVPKNPKALMEATVKETGSAPTPGGPIRLRLQAYTLPQIADVLSLFLAASRGSRVTDKTGLTGVYNTTLEFEGEDGLISAVQSQLGLKIETVKSTSEIFVLDAAQKPALQER